MDETTSSIRQFHTLEAAIAFIAECVEANAPLELFQQTVQFERQAERNVERPDHFSQFTFPALQRQFQVMDFRARYKGVSFPTDAQTFKLGGHDKELGHMHVDFSKRGAAWVIEGIWQCR